MRWLQRNWSATVFAVACLFVAIGPAGANAQFLIRFDASGANPTAISPTVDTYRTALGVLNPNMAGTQNGGMGRREINWDGTPAAFAAPNNLPANFFNSNSPRGTVFSTAGTGFQVSGANTDAGAGQPAAPNFGNINVTYTTTFQPFSGQRIFTALGSNIYDVTFFVPGSTTPAGVRGFGAVFTDVDVAANTSIQYFDLNNVAIGPALQVLAAPNGGLSFLGARRIDNLPLIGRVRITQGNSALGAGINDGGAIDLVVADDFLYGEPVAIPEPASLALTGLAVSAFAVWRRRRRGG